MGVPGDGGKDGSRAAVLDRRALSRGLSGGRFCVALRARAFTATGVGGGDPVAMRAERQPDPDLRG